MFRVFPLTIKDTNIMIHYKYFLFIIVEIVKIFSSFLNLKFDLECYIVDFSKLI